MPFYTFITLFLSLQIKWSSLVIRFILALSPNNFKEKLYCNNNPVYIGQWIQVPRSKPVILVLFKVNGSMLVDIC